MNTNSRMKFRTERQYNDHVDRVIMGPLTTREIGDLMDAGVGFEPRGLDTEYSLAALAAKVAAPGWQPGDTDYYQGVARVLEAMMGVCGARSLDEMSGIAGAMVKFGPR